jgi:2-oxoglutarate ferredoxin oxidoreductase subunit delta
MKYWRTPLDLHRVKVPHGEVHIIVDRCKGCGFCLEYCPKDVLAFSRAFNRKGYHPPEVVHPEACVNCGLCEMICPDFAIFCVSRSEEPAAPAPDRETGTGHGKEGRAA